MGRGEGRGGEGGGEGGEGHIMQEISLSCVGAVSLLTVNF